MKYNFDEIIDRSNTGSLKWDKYKERDILPLWVADMDFRSPPEVLEALHQRVDHGVFGYTKPYSEVSEEVIAYHARVHNRQINPEWICWLPGLVQGLNLCAMMSGSAGDGVMSLTPVYPPFLSAPLWQGRSLIKAPFVDNGTQWELDLDAMEAAITPETKSFFLCSPHNPVGRVFRREELESIADFCLRHGLILVSDEIHCDLVFDGEHITTSSLGKEVEDITMTMMSASKTYNIPGLACAHMIIPNRDLRSRFMRVCRGLITEVNAFGYVGCIAAYRHGEPWRLELIDYLRGNYELLFEAAKSKLAPLKFRKMEATYLAWFDARDLPTDDPTKFFEDAGVGLSNGADFGAPGFVRVNFGCPRSVLVEGIERMAKALGN